MKGDFSRSTFDPRKHYRGVRMQQGRVQLDADWNESLDVLLHRIETETIDVIGECGVPEHQAAFGAVIKLEDLPPDEQEAAKKKFFPLQPGDFLLTKGRAYVDGILVEMDETALFSKQPYANPELEKNGVYALYLDVWERLITALEDPSIRETALGGPDTAVRGQVIWQAALTQVGDQAGENVSCANVKDPWPGPSTGELCARTTPSPEPDDPCTVAPGAGYKRLENQLYRVEIHDATSGKETFKWSRENGSILVKIIALNVDGSSAKLQLASLGRDDVLGFHELDFVEVLDEAHELAGEPGLMAKILKIDPDDNVLTLDQNVSGFDVATAKLRRWESGELNVADAMADFFELEGGVEIKFTSAEKTPVFHTGDYWQIPARTIPGKIGTIEWPNEGDPSKPLCLLPFGIQHHYCKLAILTLKDGDIVDIEDCRKKFPPLTELPGGKCCCSVTVGLEGDYADLQTAIEARPQDAETWHVCLEPGTHYLQKTVEVLGTSGLVITGCELQTRLIAPDGEPAMVFGRGSQIRLEGFSLSANSPQGALIFKGSNEVRIAHLTAQNELSLNPDTPKARQLHNAAGDTGSRLGPIVVAIRCMDFEISENNFFGKPAIKAQARLLKIHENRLQGGGIQILPGSEYVEITDNLLLEGSGPGIQLGGLSSEDGKIIFDKQAPEYYDLTPVAEKTPAVLGKTPAYTKTMGINFSMINIEASSRGFSTSTLSISAVRITGNLILYMLGSGIITKNSVTDFQDFGDLEDVVISGNRISGCGSVADLDVLGIMQVGGGVVLTGVFGADITGNLITENGAGNPACGIYLLDGSEVEISGNTIVENGTADSNPDTKFYQAGIGGHFVFGNLLGDSVEGLGEAKPGYPALRVHGNEVVCPAGPAFAVVAIGGVLAEDNTFATREVRKQGGPLAQFERGCCVSILDLGIPIWYGDLLGILLAALAGNMNLHIEGDTLEKWQQMIALLPDGRVLFKGNQVDFRSKVEEKIDAGKNVDLGQLLAEATLSTYIHTLDDAGILDNQFQASVPAYVLAWYKKQKETGSSANLLAYLLKFIQVASIGTSLRATGNAISENLGSGYLSYASSAISMNLTTANQITHALLTVSGDPAKNYFNNNQSLTMTLP